MQGKNIDLREKFRQSGGSCVGNGDIWGVRAGGCPLGLCRRRGIDDNFAVKAVLQESTRISLNSLERRKWYSPQAALRFRTRYRPFRRDRQLFRKDRGQGQRSRAHVHLLAVAG